MYIIDHPFRFLFVKYICLFGLFRWFEKDTLLATFNEKIHKSYGGKTTEMLAGTRQTKVARIDSETK